MANYIATDTALTATASAIRTKRNISTTITFNASNGFADAITAIPSTDVSDTTASAADVFDNKYFYTSNGVKTKGTLPSGVVLPVENLTSIASNAYKSNASIRYVNFPACATIGGLAFSQCTSLQIANFPETTEFSGNGAFARCTSLQFVNMPKIKNLTMNTFISCYNLQSFYGSVCSTVGMRCFEYCSSLQIVNLPQCNISSSSEVFKYCSSLRSVNIPECIIIGIGCFQECINLSSVNFPKCTSVYSAVFAGCSNLQSISFPELQTIGVCAFSGCGSLKTVSFPKCTRIASSAFKNCTSLSAIYLLGSSYITLFSPSYTFENSPILNSSLLGYFGSIYVPNSMLASYKTKNNWSLIASRLVGM